MGNKALKGFLTAFLLVFYVVIILFVQFNIFEIQLLENCAAALTFEIIDMILLAFYIMTATLSKKFKIGYMVPLIMVTVFYTILIDILNFTLVATASNSIFVLVHLIILFVYCLISIPMFLMGIGKE